MYRKGKDLQHYGTSFPSCLDRNKLHTIVPLKPIVHGNSHVLEIPELTEPQRKSRMKPYRQKATLREKNILSTLNIPGLEKIIHSSNHWQKFVWICAVLGFYGLCVYQLVDRVTLYFNAPIVLDVTIEKETSVKFPSMTICPPFGKMTLYYKYCQERRKKKKIAGLSFARNNLTLEEIWEEFGIRIDEITTTSSQCNLADINEAKKRSSRTPPICGAHMEKNVEPFPTFWGNCLRITPTVALRYRGAWTFIRYKVARSVESLSFDRCQENEQLKQLENETVFIPHSRHIVPTHQLAQLYYRVRKGSEVFVNFHLKQYKYLNTKKNPCVNQTTSAICQQACLEKSLNKTVPCRLPYMQNISLESCKSFPVGDLAQLKVEKAYKEFDNCNCSRSCDETVLSFDSDFQATDDNAAAFSLKYPDNDVEIITERFSYTFSSLLSDIGGNLGFCVGLCLFSFIEVIVSTFQLTVSWLLQKCTKRAGKPFVVKPSKHHYLNPYVDF